MIREFHQPQSFNYHRYVIISDDIKEVLSFVIPRIRQSSQEYYSNEIVKDLNEKGFTLIDAHAGQSNNYLIYLLCKDKT
jgi:hypothetical protein